jgi:hypothetical protein
MRVSLVPHPDCRCEAVSAIEVEAERAGEALRLRYRALGDMRRLLVPAPAFSERADDLWRTTCFEAFVRGGGDRYCEFNLAPSTRWAAYAFDSYRAGMREFAVAPMEIETTVSETCLELSAIVLPGEAGPWRVGLSAVIEETNGANSYWALLHPPGKPDFHHAACFDLELA